ncbi:MAG: ArsA family ATPase [Calditrichaeota bacterium]|nr:MAG: ArsA family ATPase [Calditrichota bacterium]
MSGQPTLLFFMGKGGVGKSTLSALTALYLSRREETLLLSLDPAHNLSDLFETDLGDRPKSLGKRLQAAEIDVDRWNRRYLKEAESRFKKAYAYLTSFNLDKHFAVIRHAPGVMPHALTQALVHHVNTTTARWIVVDTPPTALTLSLLGLPELSLLWLRQLRALRASIVEKHQLIHTLRLGNRTFERDRVMDNINRQYDYWHGLQQRYRDTALSRLFVIENEATLSQKENQRIIQQLKALHLPEPKICLNKTDSTNPKGFPRALPLTGKAALRTYMEKYEERFRGLIADQSSS